MALSLQHLRSHGAGLTSPTTATPVAAYCYPGSDVPYHDPDWCVCERWVLLADLVYNSADDANLSRVGQGGAAELPGQYPGGCLGWGREDSSAAGLDFVGVGSSRSG